MTTGLWTIYLALLLLFTLSSLTTAIKAGTGNNQETGIEHVVIIICSCIAWAIWYMYFLH